jgi:hypothetical protein
METRVCEFIDECNRSILGAFKNEGITQLVIPFMPHAHSLLIVLNLCLDCAQPLLNCAIPLSNFTLCPFLHTITMPKHYEPSSYADLFTIPEFSQCREVFLRTGWGSFLAHL